MAARTSRSSRSTSGRSRSSPEPPLHFTTLFTGQPKLMSRMSKPRSWHMRAASAITAGIGAEQLRRDGMLLRLESQVFAACGCAFVAPARRAHAVRAGELGHNQPAAAQAADEAPENGIGDARHGRQHGGGSDPTPPICKLDWKSQHGNLVIT